MVIKLTPEAIATHWYEKGDPMVKHLDYYMCSVCAYKKGVDGKYLVNTTPAQYVKLSGYKEVNAYGQKTVANGLCGIHALSEGITKFVFMPPPLSAAAAENKTTQYTLVAVNPLWEHTPNNTQFGCEGKTITWTGDYQGMYHARAEWWVPNSNLLSNPNPLSLFATVTWENGNTHSTRYLCSECALENGIVAKKFAPLVGIDGWSQIDAAAGFGCEWEGVSDHGTYHAPATWQAKNYLVGKTNPANGELASFLCDEHAAAAGVLVPETATPDSNWKTMGLESIKYSATVTPKPKVYTKVNIINPEFTPEWYTVDAAMGYVCESCTTEKAEYTNDETMLCTSCAARNGVVLMLHFGDDQWVPINEATPVYKRKWNCSVCANDGIDKSGAYVYQLPSYGYYPEAAFESSVSIGPIVVSCLCLEHALESGLLKDESGHRWKSTNNVKLVVPTLPLADLLKRLPRIPMEKIGYPNQAKLERRGKHKVFRRKQRRGTTKRGFISAFSYPWETDASALNMALTGKVPAVYLDGDSDAHVSGLNFNRDLKIANVAADFYLLAHAAFYDDDVDAYFRDYSKYIADQFARYVECACFGEARYARTCIQDTSKYTFLKNKHWRKVFDDICSGTKDREKVWSEFPKYAEKYGHRNMNLFIVNVHSMNWGGRAYGGPKWAVCAKTVLAYRRQRLTHTAWVDTAFGLQHNGNIVFDKLWNVSNVKVVLDANLAGDMKKVAKYATKEVRDVWLKCTGMTQENDGSETTASPSTGELSATVTESK